VATTERWWKVQISPIGNEQAGVLTAVDRAVTRYSVTMALYLSARAGLPTSVPPPTALCGSQNWLSLFMLAALAVGSLASHFLLDSGPSQLQAFIDAIFFHPRHSVTHTIAEVFKMTYVK